MEAERLNLKELSDIAEAKSDARSALRFTEIFMEKSKQVDDMRGDIREIRADVKYVVEFIERAPEIFASKWTEKIVAGLVGLVMIAVGAAVVAGVVKAAEYVIK